MSVINHKAIKRGRSHMFRDIINPYGFETKEQNYNLFNMYYCTRIYLC